MPFRNGLNRTRSSAEGYISLSLSMTLQVQTCAEGKQQHHHSRQGPRSPSSQSFSIAVYLLIHLGFNSPGGISSFFSSQSAWDAGAGDTELVRADTSGNRRAYTTKELCNSHISLPFWCTPPKVLYHIHGHLHKKIALPMK